MSLRLDSWKLFSVISFHWGFRLLCVHLYLTLKFFLFIKWHNINLHSIKYYIISCLFQVFIMLFYMDQYIRELNYFDFFPSGVNVFYWFLFYLDFFYYYWSIYQLPPRFWEACFSHFCVSRVEKAWELANSYIKCAGSDVE